VIFFDNQWYCWYAQCRNDQSRSRKFVIYLNFVFMYKAFPLIEHLPKYKRGRDIRHSISEEVFIMKY